MKGHERLLVVWSEAERGTRHVVGELSRREDGRFAFGYDLELLPEAEAAGFRLFAEFPLRRGTQDPYQASYLFATFAQRIPSPRRPDFQRMMTTWRVDQPDDQMAILAASGGIQLTDHIELAEYRSNDDDLSVPLEFRVAGEKYYQGTDLLNEGELVEFRREPANPRDTKATCILVRDGQQLGYVPRQYAPLFARLMDQGAQLIGHASRRLLLPPERDRWIIRARTAHQGR
jgi:hypothetical protein